MTIHPDSLKMLKTLGVDMEKMYKYQGVLLSKHYDLCNTKFDEVYSENKLKQIIDEFDDVEVATDKDCIEYN